MNKKRILIDLDGILNEYGQLPYEENNIPKIKDGAAEFVEKLSQLADLYLFTSRNLLLSAKWLIKNQIDEYFVDITNVKLPSSLYVDDRCLCFKGNYDKTLDEIRQFKPYWQ